MQNSTSHFSGSTTIEPFVDADEIASFVSITRRQVMALARNGEIPAHPVGGGTRRRVWRFRLSEVASHLENALARKPSAGAQSAQAVPRVAKLGGK